MRVTFYKNIKTMSGTCRDGKMTFMSKKNDSICIVRRYVYPTITNQNNIMGANSLIIATLWKEVSESFKNDLQLYANAYNSQHLSENKLRVSSYNIFVKGMNFLDTVTNDSEIVSRDLGSTVNEWILTGALPAVHTSVQFTNAMWN